MEPFDLNDPEDREELKDAWIMDDAGDFLLRILGFRINCLFCTALTAIGELSADELLSDWHFETGAPCGKVSKGH